MYRGIFILFVLIPFFAASTKGADKLKFNYLTTSDGLSNNYVTDVLEDDNGFLWFSTSDGLNKWNGYELEIFKNNPEDTNSLSSNFIITLDQDFNNNIWIGTNQAGLVRYNLSNEKFYRYISQLSIANAVQSTYIRKIVVSADSVVWVATDLGLSMYQPETDDFKRIRFDSNSSQEIINNIVVQQNGNVVFQTSSGVFTYDIHQKTFSRFELNGLDGWDIQNVPLCFASNHQLWIGAETGLVKYDLKSGKYAIYKHHVTNSRSISSQVFSCIFEDSKQNIWIGTKDGGLNQYNSSSDDFSNYRAGTFNGAYLSNNIITQIYEDHYQNIWLATQEGGLTYFNANEIVFQFYDHQPNESQSLLNNKVSAFTQDENGNIWIGTGSGGLHQFDAENGKFERYQLNTEIVSPSILGLFSAHEELYVAGWGVGLQVFDVPSKQFKKIKSPESQWPNSIPLNIKGMGTDKQGNIWLANHTSDGLFVYDPSTGRIYNSLNPGPFNAQILSVPYAVDMFQDFKNRIWIISYTGLYLFDGQYHQYKYSAIESNSIRSNYIYTIFQSADSSIWIGHTNGLEKLLEADGQIRFEHYSENYHLPDNVKGILEDNNNHLWLSSNQGLAMFNPKSKEQRLFQINKEVPGQEFFERACLKSNAGDLYFGTTNGFYKFNPDSLHLGNDEPKIFLTNFKIFNEKQKVGAEGSPLTHTMSETTEVVLKYNQSVISFEYVALSLDKPGKVEYAYQMEGINRDWNFVGDKRFANYTNLSPGEYVFKVRTSSGSQLSQNNEASIKIIITPPFWRTTWAYIVYIVSFLGLFFLLQLAVINRVKLINDLKVEKLKIENVQETNLMKLRFFTNISHEFRTPLTLIKAPIEKLIHDGNDMKQEDRSYHYDLIFNSTQKMLKMVNQLMDYRKLEAGSLVLEPSVGDLIAFCKKTVDNFNYLAAQKRINYNFITEIEKLFIAFDPDKLDKVLSNVLANAFKNTPDEGTIEFIIHEDKNTNEANIHQVELLIRDTGFGIPEKDLPHIFERFYMVSHSQSNAVQGTGIGLTLAKELIELHKGTISVKSEENKGTEFIIHLPVSEVSKNHAHTAELEAVDEQVNVVEFKNDVAESQKKHCILVVEDDEELAAFIKHELNAYYQVILANNGKDGLQKVKSEKPDLVLSDVMMPEMDGIELCRNIKNNEQTSHIPVILLTARYAQEKELEGFESGADAYVLKPFNLSILMSQVSNLLNVRKEIIEKFRNGTSLFFDDEALESKEQKLMQEIINLVIENISEEKINANFIADKMHMSRSLVYIKIEALTGQTVNEFIRNIRLKKAIQLLKQQEATITEVAYAVGFSSQSYFTRSFVKQFGSSPKEYQKKQQTAYI
ncbi:MAG: two-component regulator propeller domain-containing protein [Prolixibacteraceae bacterium]